MSCNYDERWNILRFDLDDIWIEYEPLLDKPGEIEEDFECFFWLYLHKHKCMNSEYDLIPALIYAKKSDVPGRNELITEELIDRYQFKYSTGIELRDEI